MYESFKILVFDNMVCIVANPYEFFYVWQIVFDMKVFAQFD